MAILRQPWRWMPFGVRLQIARLRGRISQHRMIQRGALVGVLVLSASVIIGARVQASAAQAQWGNTIDVLVVTNALAPGDALGNYVELAARPSAFVPDDAMSTLVDATEHAVRSLEPGDIVTRRDLASTGHAVALDDGERAVSLPLTPGIPHLTVGDRVELFVVFDTFGEPDVVPQAIEGAVVVDVGDDGVTVAVAAGDVATLARASVSGQVIVARR